MARPRPPHLHKETSRHGSVTWYVRRGKGPRIRIRGEYGSREFLEAYEAAIRSEPVAREASKPTGTLEWLVDQYERSAAWSMLSPATRKQRRSIFNRVLETASKVRIDEITTRTIEAGRDRRRETPFAAMDFIKAMRGLFGWARETGHVEIDPTEGVKGFVTRTKGWHVWTEEEVARFEARWPVGTRERLAMAVLLFTGLRRGDAARLGPQHVSNGVISLDTEKTGTAVVIPMLPELAEIIAASPVGDKSFIATLNGRPMVKEGFGNWFAEACQAAGVPGRAHGLRKAGATRAANNGATQAELEAIFGWEGGKMASLYTRQANRKKLAERAMSKLGSIPAPEGAGKKDA